MFFFLQNSSLLFSITRSSSFSAIHVSVNVKKKNVEKDTTLLFFLSQTRDEKTDLPNAKGEVKRAIKATFAHVCTTLTRDKCLPLPRSKASLQAIKAVFVTPLTATFDARQRYISLAFVPLSKASSNMSEIQAKGVTKARQSYVCD